MARLSIFETSPPPTGKFMPARVFNPKLILLQMAIVQSVFYLSFVVGTVFVQILLGFPISLAQFFDYRCFTFGTSAGWVLIVCYWVEVVCVLSYAVFKTIERTRKCLDFVVSVGGFHFLFSSIFCGIPASFAWWFVVVIGTVACTVAAERLCMREAQKDIQLDANTHERSECAQSC